MSQKYKILLYYKYVSLADPQAIQQHQKALCAAYDLRGRILISDEGINGTLAGLPADIDAYVAETEKIPEFADMEWKISWADEQVFPKLRVVVREEIVTLGIKKKGQDVAISNKADYIEPAELRQKYEQQGDFVIIDARNLYEAEIGKFKNAIVPPIRNFREFPDFVAKNLQQYKDKEVITYCTGGVRCEKASAYLREQGFKNVRQLHGGIHEYGEKAGGKDFEGEMFVFDKRLHIPVNRENPTTISRCQFCQTTIARYVDCSVTNCNSLFVCCPECENEWHGACSESCKEQVVAQLTTLMAEHQPTLCEQ